MNIVTALQCEADPIIQAFDLSGTDPSAPFQLYRNENLHLIISNPGKTCAAAAVSFLAANSKGFEREEVWLNVGVAGHPERDIGEAVFAGKIVDQETEEAWYPQPVYPVEPDLELVRTVAEPVQSFEEPDAHDMEAAGFYETALRFTTVERAHVLKIISDNGDRTPDELDRSEVRDLVSDRMDVIRSFLQSYEDMTQRDSYLEVIREIKRRVTDQVHFTEAQKHQLQKQLERWRSVYPERDVMEVVNLEEGEANAKDILDTLSSEVASAKMTFQASS